ncbi:hypothetical protein BU23DRAFT_601017 [Bimuria novae-zelandiae CBS 107.79]|uniref:Uncharacterized protein n=1 Tax=Bimuria novae-zelandiae CBS 107.79 TaxID=1447943 RepID=A0A6A5V5I3_9PLEO|nr:hypothetical protein BU23DRAFT_601017 [Bimuria novae-zelandiae CBS 107.79]
MNSICTKQLVEFPFIIFTNIGDWSLINHFTHQSPANFEPSYNSLYLYQRQYVSNMSDANARIISRVHELELERSYESAILKNATALYGSTELDVIVTERLHTCPNGHRNRMHQAKLIVYVEEVGGEWKLLAQSDDMYHRAYSALQDVLTQVRRDLGVNTANVPVNGNFGG